MTTPPPELSIVVPAYNEERLLSEHLERIVDHGRRLGSGFEVLVVDDGSTDRTAELAAEASRERPEIRLLRLTPNRGKGHAVRTGLGEARGRIVGFTDADGATDIAELARILPHFDGGAALVIGSRARPAPDVTLQAHLHRKIIGRTFNSLLRALLDLRDAEGRPIADTQCGFKWMTAAAAELLLPHLSIDGFAFDVELLFLARQLDLPVSEVGVSWRDRGASRVDLLRDPVTMLADALDIRRRHRHLGR